MTSTQRSRARVFPFNHGESRSGLYFQGKPYGTMTVTNRRTNSVENCFDTLNEWPPPDGEAQAIDRGGYFRLTKREIFGDIPIVSIPPKANTQYGSSPYYYGPLPALREPSSLLAWPTAAALSDAEMTAVGATAIAKTIPTNSIVDIAVTLGELASDGIPKIVGQGLLKDRVRTVRERSGGEYLNVEFGIKPLISDLQKLADVVKNSEKYLSQLRRDSGRNVRRRREMSYEETELVEYDGALSGRLYAYPDNPYNSQHFSPSGRLRISTKSRRRIWFSGCYTYYLDPGSDALSRASRISQEADKLLGLKLTPEVIWNLAPWSWLADWQSNIGDVIHNYSAFAQDGLVLRYGYLMCETSSEKTYQVTNLVPNHPGTVCPSSFSTTLKTTVKQRMKADPYGFGVTPESLTARQNAILLALGMTKFKRK